MNQTLIVTDSASDVPAELEARYGIRILPFSIVVDGKSYVERKDFTPAEFYQMMLSAHDLPDPRPDHADGIRQGLPPGGRGRLPVGHLYQHQLPRLRHLQQRPGRDRAPIRKRTRRASFRSTASTAFPIPSATAIWPSRRQRRRRRGLLPPRLSSTAKTGRRSRPSISPPLRWNTSARAAGSAAPPPLSGA